MKEAKARLAEQEAQNRLKLGSKLIKLQQQIETEVPPEKLREEIRRILDTVMPFEELGEEDGSSEEPADEVADSE